MPSVETHRYGDAPSQHGALHLPDGAGPHPVVVLVHGGFWWARYDRTLMTPLALDVVRRGWAAWNIEYRRVGEPGGGWPGTFDDAAAAVDHLAALAAGGTGEPSAPLDLDRVVSLGHSAGGHLALWLAARPGLPAGSPGAGPAVRLRGAVSLAGVADLEAGCHAGLGLGACADLMGGRPDEVPERYELASPAARLPLGVAQVVVHGGDDRLVPVGLGRAYADAARAAGDEVEWVELPGVGHFEVIDPGHPAWEAAADRLPHLLRP
jgi:acetyl esterase/lipase